MFWKLALCLILGGLDLEQYVQGYIPGNDEFPMGMGYNEEFNIKRVKPKKPIRKTIGSYRLPKSVIPIHYDLEIRPILEKGNDTEINTAPGKVDIRISVNETTNSITLHAKELWIDSSAVAVIPDGPLPRINVTGFNFDEERNFYTVFLDGDLFVGKEYNLIIPFRCKLLHHLQRMAGLYRTSFLGSDGLQKTGVVTQFQKDDASRAFPCFDEPHLKATFSIKIGRLREYNSFSNMERIGEPKPIEGLDGWVWDTYEKTLLFPTYVIAFAVMPDYVEEVTPPGLNNVTIMTWVPKAHHTGTSVKFAASAAGRILTYFEELFDIPFYLKKMENLAVSNIDLLAMEHPGLVTYRTNLLVWKKGMDTQYNLFDGASLIAHEFAHQWFGNLVTCNWWNDFWLNEAFARYYQFIGADQSGINFRAGDRFVIDVTQWAMEFDEGPETVSIRNEETDKVFYQPFHIEYEKGAAMIRMMQSFLTQKTFIKALRKYFKKHAFKTVVQDDLYNALTEQAVEDGTLEKYTVGEIMKPWLAKTGFPVLHVSRGDSNNLYITQQRFIVHPKANDKIEPGLWYVPVWFVTNESPEIDMDNFPPNLWLEQDTLTKYLPVNATTKWVILNPQARGYYRVVYDRSLIANIVKQLEEDHTVFVFATKSQLIDDHFRSAQARYISIEHALALLSYLPNEDDLIVWTTVFNNLRKLYVRISDTPIIDTFKKYVVNLIEQPMKRLGTHLPDTASPSDIMLHALFLDWLCMMEDKICAEIVAGYMSKWIANPKINPIPVDLTSTVTCASVALLENRKAYYFLIDLYKVERNERFQMVLARALTCSKKENELKELVENAINPDFKDIDFTKHGQLVLTNLVRNPNGKKVVWETIKSQAQSIREILGNATIPRVVEALAPFMSNRGSSQLNYEFLDFIQAYMKNTDVTDFPQALEILGKAAQLVVDNSLWMDYFYEDLSYYLKSKVVE